MEVKELSMLDAFRALDDIKDDELLTNEQISNLKKLRESKAFDVFSAIDIDAAEEELNKPVVQKDELEVIDANADTVEHLKDNKDYVGQFLLRCNSCRNVRFIDGDKLIEGHDPDDPNILIYNVEEECPYCHGLGKGYSLAGQVAKVKIEEPEAVVSNDNVSAEGEMKFNNDLENEKPQEEKPAEEEEVKEEEPVAEEEVEMDYNETNATDDVEEDEVKLGDVFDEDDVKYDDTEEEPEKKDFADILPELETEDEEEDKKKEKKESLSEEVEEREPMGFEKLNNFTDYIVSPLNIEEVVVYDENDNEIYNGSFDEVPNGMFDSEFVSFNVGDGRLIVNIDLLADKTDEDYTLKDVLNLFDDEFNDKIDIWDIETGDNIFSGTKKSCIETYGYAPFYSIEHPDRLVVKLRNIQTNESFKPVIKENLNLTSPEDRLLFNICLEKKLSTYRLNREGTLENAIADTVKTREPQDLKAVYENYIKGSSNELIREFKEVTGYKDALDLLEEKEFVNEAKLTQKEAFDLAKKTLKEQNAYSVIYGYQSSGKFVPIEPQLVSETEREHKLNAEIARRKYHFNGSLYTLYRDSSLEEMEFKTEEELMKKIKECKEANLFYKVKKAVTEGFKYKLVCEKLLKEGEASFFGDEEEPEEQDEAVMHERDVRFVDELLRITHETAEAIREIYHLETIEKELLIDLINDLDLTKPEGLENIEMENARDFLLNAFAGLNRSSEDDEELKEVLELVLDSNTFSSRNIKKRIASDYVFNGLKNGDAPGVVYPDDPSTIVRSYTEEIDDVEEGLHVDMFENFVNKWLDENLEETKVFEALSIKEDEGNYIVSGLMLSEDKDEEVSFKVLKEENDYKVSSDYLKEELIYNGR